MENYSFSSDTGQDKTELESAWRISVLTLDEKKLKDNAYNCYFSCDSGQDKVE